MLLYSIDVGKHHHFLFPHYSNTASRSYQSLVNLGASRYWSIRVEASKEDLFSNLVVIPLGAEWPLALEAVVEYDQLS